MILDHIFSDLPHLCLQVTTTLCSALELHNRCGQVLEPLTALICPDQTEALKGGKKSKEGPKEHSTVAKINLVDLMVIEDILQDRPTTFSHFKWGHLTGMVHSKFHILFDIILLQLPT